MAETVETSPRKRPGKNEFADKVAALKVPAGKREAYAWDPQLAGFGVRAYSGGKKSFILKYQLANGQQRKMVLGQFLADKLDDKRKEAYDILHGAKKQGRDYVGEQREERKRAAVAEQKQKLVGDLIRDYLAIKQTQVRASTYREVERHLAHIFKPLHDRQIETLTRRDIVAIVDDRVIKGHPVQADRAKTSMVGFCGWCMEYDYLAGNIAVGIRQRTPAEQVRRDRVLSMKELATVWSAMDGEDDYSKIVRMLILSGARADEIGQLEWNELDLQAKEISLPRQRTKSGVAHTIYLSGPAISILETMVQRPRKKHVFGRQQSTGFSGWSKAKKKLDAKLGEDVRPWRVHDLRRSLRTNAGNLSLAPMVVLEAALGHWGTAKPGVVGTYDHSKHDPERRKLMDDWAAAVLAHAEK